MSQWFKDTDAKKLICVLFSCLIMAGGIIYKKDQAMLADRHDSNATDLTSIKALIIDIRKDQLKNKEHFNTKIDAEVSKLEGRIETFEARVTSVEKDIIKLGTR